MQAREDAARTIAPCVPMCSPQMMPMSGAVLWSMAANPCACVPMPTPIPPGDAHFWHRGQEHGGRDNGHPGERARHPGAAGRAHAALSRNQAGQPKDKQALCVRVCVCVHALCINLHV